MKLQKDRKWAKKNEEQSMSRVFISHLMSGVRSWRFKKRQLEATKDAWLVKVAQRWLSWSLSSSREVRVCFLLFNGPDSLPLPLRSQEFLMRMCSVWILLSWLCQDIQRQRLSWLCRTSARLAGVCQPSPVTVRLSMTIQKSWRAFRQISAYRTSGETNSVSG